MTVGVVVIMIRTGSLRFGQRIRSMHRSEWCKGHGLGRRTNRSSSSGASSSSATTRFFGCKGNGCLPTLPLDDSSTVATRKNGDDPALPCHCNYSGFSNHQCHYCHSYYHSYYYHSSSDRPGEEALPHGWPTREEVAAPSNYCEDCFE